MFLCGTGFTHWGQDVAVTRYEAHDIELGLVMFGQVAITDSWFEGRTGKDWKEIGRRLGGDWEDNGGDWEEDEMMAVVSCLTAAENPFAMVAPRIGFQFYDTLSKRVLVSSTCPP